MTVAARRGPLPGQHLGEAPPVEDAGDGVGHGQLLGARQHALELDVALLQLLSGLAGAQRREDAGLELLIVHGLGQVVVGADVEALDALAHLALDRQHDDDDVAGAIGQTHPAAHAVAVDVVEDHVEQHHVGGLGADQLERLEAACGGADLEAALAQHLGQVLALGARVLHEQDAGFGEIGLGHEASLARSQGPTPTTVPGVAPRRSLCG